MNDGVAGHRGGRLEPQVLGPFASVCVPLSAGVPSEHGIEEGGGAGEGGGEVGLDVDGVSQAPVRIGPSGRGRWEAGGQWLSGALREGALERVAQALGFDRG